MDWPVILRIIAWLFQGPTMTIIDALVFLALLAVISMSVASALMSRALTAALSRSKDDF